MASIILRDLAQPSDYMDRTFPGTREEWDLALKKSNTLYIGNLSFYSTEEQIHELFSKCGEIKRIIMGLDKIKMTPCGFCFIEYYEHNNALDCLRYINGTKLDDRIIRVDLDPGFREGRQFGRGKHGGQIRDMFRTEFDPGRGGWAASAEEKVSRPEPHNYVAQYNIVGVKRKAEGDSDHVSKRTHKE